MLAIQCLKINFIQILFVLCSVKMNENELNSDNATIEEYINDLNDNVKKIFTDSSSTTVASDTKKQRFWGNNDNRIGEVYIKYILIRSFDNNDICPSLYNFLKSFADNQNRKDIFSRLLYLQNKIFELRNLKNHFDINYEKIRHKLIIKGIESPDLFMKIKIIYETQQEYNTELVKIFKDEMTIILNMFFDITHKEGMAPTYKEKEFQEKEIIYPNFKLEFLRNELKGLDIIVREYKKFKTNLIEECKGFIENIKLAPYDIYRSITLLDNISSFGIKHIRSMANSNIVSFLNHLYLLLNKTFKNENNDVNITEVYKYGENQSTVIHKYLETHYNIKGLKIEKIKKIIYDLYIEGDIIYDKIYNSWCTHINNPRNK